jgi:glycosyltransferase involved in cell wall biosynthesis
MVNKFYRPVGGPETVVRETTEALTRDGHEVIPFSMHHPDNWPSEWSDYFVSNVDYRKGRYGSLRLASEALRMVYSVEARRKIEALIAKVRPDLAHLHNIYHQISPSILPALKKAGVANVLTLHDGKLMCPAYFFLVRGEICERCGGSRFYNCFLRKCVKNSRLKSLLCTTEMYVHRMTGIYKRNIDVFISPSEFHRSRLLAAGLAAPDRVLKITNSIDVESIQPSEPGDYALYLGQLDSHKGVLTLLKAMEQCPDVPLRMAGQGPLEAECARQIEDKRLKNVQMTGFLTGHALQDTIRGALFLVLPSECHENCPMAVLEAAAYGKPAVVTNIGGLPELIEEGVTGFLAPPRNPEELASKIALLGRDRDLVRQMGRRAREKAEREFSHAVYYDKLVKAYSLAMKLAAK